MLQCVRTTKIMFHDLIPKKTERKTWKFQCFQMCHMSFSRFSIPYNTYQAFPITLSEFQASVQPWKYHIKLKFPPPKLLLWAQISQDLGHRSSGAIGFTCDVLTQLTGHIRVLRFHLLGWLCVSRKSAPLVVFLCFQSWVCLRVSMHFPLQYMSIQCLLFKGFTFREYLKWLDILLYGFLDGRGHFQ